MATLHIDRPYKATLQEEPYIDAWDVVSSGPELGGGTCSADRGPHAIDVVLANKDNRQFPQGSHIVGLKHLQRLRAYMYKE